LSEEAKVAYIKEKIGEANRNRYLAYAIGLVGAPFIGFFLPLQGVPDNASFGLFLVFLVSCGLVGSYYGSVRKKLMKELQEMAYKTKE
jgi:hypothetical protein